MTSDVGLLISVLFGQGANLVVRGRETRLL